MSIRFVTLSIRKTELCTIQESFPAWEVPLLEAMFDDVQPVGEELIERDAPDAQDEYTRLMNRYSRPVGEDGTPAMPVVVSVYGQHRTGVSNLQRAIEAAVVASTVTEDETAGLLA